MTVSPLLTDLYELTMAQGYFVHDRNPRVVFDVFFRRQPFGGGFSIFAGLDDAVDALRSLRFSGEDLAYLESIGLFSRRFLDMLAELRFHGDIWSVPEGTPIFPNEPIMRVEGTLVESQILESMLLAIVNFQSLIATKAARMFIASRRGTVIEFGLRRAQGIDGALSASRAAYVGGAAATSNVLAGQRFGIPVRGTMAHSWVMAFDNELDSFERYADLYPDASVFLIDTYDTLESGIENAIRVGKKLAAKGRRFGVRLDSGDLQYLSKRVRARLDESGLTDATILVSNELNEEIIHELVNAGSPIDGWGVGTQLVTGGSDSAFSGVYKLAAKEQAGRLTPTIKVSNNVEKTTTPGVKQVYRYFDRKSSAVADLVALSDEPPPERPPVAFHHPALEGKSFTLRDFERCVPLLQPVMRGGERTAGPVPLAELRNRTVASLDQLDETYTRFLNPHIYKVSLSRALRELKTAMVRATVSADERSGGGGKT